MSKLELGHLIHQALRHTLQEQEKLLKHERLDFLPVIRNLARFTLELEDWYSDKFHLKDRSDYFLSEATKIEDQADRISEELWVWAPVSLTPIFTKIRDRRVTLRAEKSYTRQLRSQYNNFRLGLLEQVAGARLLENNSDLGEEVERILMQYLERRLGTSMRILRGGHIYNYDNVRSGQIDIIVTPADALGFSPADTGGGKFNVIIDQVIAAISVTSRLTPAALRERWRGFQTLPIYSQKDQDFPNLKEHAWPLCYIIGAESEDWEEIKKTLKELVCEPSSHVPQMLLLLDSGYVTMPNACWPRSRLGQQQLHTGTEIYAGLGLAWLEAQLVGRNSVLGKRSLAWVERFAERLTELELTELSPTYDPRQHPLQTNVPIHGILNWGWEGVHVHNQLFVSSICVGESTLLSDKPIDAYDWFGRYQFEPRWFRAEVVGKKGDYCALEEWIDPRDRQKHSRRIAVFDSRTGGDVTSRLSGPLAACSELENLEPVFGEKQDK